MPGPGRIAGEFPIRGLPVRALLHPKCNDRSGGRGDPRGPCADPGGRRGAGRRSLRGDAFGVACARVLPPIEAARRPPEPVFVGSGAARGGGSVAAPTGAKLEAQAHPGRGGDRHHGPVVHLAGVQRAREEPGERGAPHLPRGRGLRRGGAAGRRGRRGGDGPLGRAGVQRQRRAAGGDPRAAARREGEGGDHLRGRAGAPGARRGGGAGSPARGVGHRQGSHRDRGPRPQHSRERRLHAGDRARAATSACSSSRARSTWCARRSASPRSA
ncbi:hypothetical protein BH11MYX4_BH11MYX4_14170 [soil metagenome]